MSDEVAFPVQDLVERITLGLSRGGPLLSREERQTIEAVLGLEGEAALLHARLAGRVPRAFRVPDLVAAGVEDVPAAVAGLAGAGLAAEPTWSVRAEHASRVTLSAGCRRLGLPRGGRRAELAGRLVDREDWDDAPWIELPHRDLVLRLERWGTLQVQPDRSRPVLERMGVRRWVDHPTTGAGRIAPSRAAWDAWEALVASLDGLDGEGCLEALDRPWWPPGGLDLRRVLVRRARELAREAERSDEGSEALAIWEGLVERGFLTGAVAQRRALCLEKLGRLPEALAGLREAREQLDGADSLTVARTGRRLARKLRGAWTPAPPLRPARPRTLLLARVDDDDEGVRPRYVRGEGSGLVEAAVAERVADAGRTVVEGEGRLWTTVFSLLFVDGLFAPVADQLPVARLRGPLDAWTPAFAARRPGRVQATLDAVAAGQAPRLLQEAWTRHEGCEITGVDWHRASVDELMSLLEGLGPGGVRVLMEPLLRRGRRASRGLPDLVVLPGPQAAVEGLHPSRIPEGVVFVEVKGEHDTLRDAQRVWLDRLSGAGIAAELWRIVPPTARGPARPA